MLCRTYVFYLMRKFLAISTFLLVGALAFFSMSKIAYAVSDVTVYDSGGFLYIDSQTNGWDKAIYHTDGTLYSYATKTNHGNERCYYDQDCSSGTVMFADGTYIFKESTIDSYPSGRVFDSPDWDEAKTIVFGIVDGRVAYYNDYVLSGATRFIYALPVGGTIVSTTTAVGGSVYVNGNDILDYDILRVKFWQDSAFACGQAVNVYDAFVCSGDNAPGYPFEIVFDEPVDRMLYDGFYDLSATTTFPKGGLWNAVFTLEKVKERTFWFDTVQVVISTTTQFTVGQLNAMDIVRGAIASSSIARTNEMLRGIGAILASSTAQLATSCNIISSSFNMGDCMVLMIWPGRDAIEDNYLIFRSMPPWGYGFRVYDILTATTTGSLPVLYAVVPPGLPGAGASITLDASHVLDFVLNATSSSFSSGNATSTGTIFEITNYYWSMFLYVLAGLYVMGRIFGRVFRPNVSHVTR